jgi:hypothetical protein
VVTIGDDIVTKRTSVLVPRLFCKKTLRHSQDDLHASWNRRSCIHSQLNDDRDIDVVASRPCIHEPLRRSRACEFIGSAGPPMTSLMESGYTRFQERV